MAQELAAHLATIWILRRQIDEARRGLSVDFGIKVCPSHVQAADLLTLRRLRVVDRLVAAAPSHREADDRPERLERRRRGKVRRPRGVAGFELPGDKATPVIRLSLVAFIGVDPPDRDRRLAGALVGSLTRHFEPYLLVGEEL